uniref:Uncharacterized protein n=1 Tax=Romanomermis culicivorax TaxID=13658 RepID=A0A915JDL2_ROMCU
MAAPRSPNFIFTIFLKKQTSFDYVLEDAPFLLNQVEEYAAWIIRCSEQTKQAMDHSCSSKPQIPMHPSCQQSPNSSSSYHSASSMASRKRESATPSKAGQFRVPPEPTSFAAALPLQLQRFQGPLPDSKHSCLPIVIDNR